MDEIIINPEVEIFSLTKTIRHLVASMSNVNLEPSFQTDLFSIQRQLEMITNFYKDYVIAVAGQQGVGKSTMVSNYLGIPELLPISIGNDEAYPVFINEVVLEDCEYRTVNSYYKACLNGVDEIQKEKITEVEFKNQVCYPGDKTVLWYEIEIHTNSEELVLGGRKLMVLPGYNPYNKRELYTTKLVEGALRHAAACVVCFDATTFAQRSNMDFIHDIIMPYFSKSTPIFMLTKSSANSEDLEFRNNVVATLGLMETANDRIINTWARLDNDDIMPWTMKLTSALSKYSVTTADFREQQLKNLSETLNKIKEIIHSIDDEAFLDSVKNDLEFNSYRKPYLDARNRLMKKFDIKLRDNLTSISNQINKDIDKELMRDLFPRIKRALQLGFDRDRQLSKFKESIEEKFVVPMQQAVITSLKQTILSSTQPIPLPAAQQTTYVPYIESWYEKDGIESQLPTLSSENKGTYKALMNLFNSDGESIKSLEKENVEGALSTLPVLLFEWMKLSQLQGLQKQITSPDEIDREKEIKDMFSRIGTELEAEQKGLSKAMIAFASLAGFDSLNGAIDGSIQLPNLITGIGLKASGTAFGMVLWGVVALALADAAWKNVLKSERAEKHFANSVCATLTESVYAKVRESVSECLDNTQEKVEKMIQIRLNKSDNYNNTFQYSKCKSLVLNSVNKLLEYDILKNRRT